MASSTGLPLPAFVVAMVAASAIGCVLGFAARYLTETPEPVKLELPTPETNFSYMVQWWIFALIAAAGYPLVLRRVAQNRVRGDQTPDDDPVDLPGSGAADVPVATGNDEVPT